MTFSLRITDRNGNAADRELLAQKRSQAWDEYTALWGNYAIAQIDLLQDGECIHRTEHRLPGTPDAYRISGTP